MPRETPAGRTLALVGALFVLSSLVIILVGNRWASYIVTPVPGLFLPDALYAFGSLLGFGQLHKLKSAPRWFWWTFGVVVAYTTLALMPEFIRIPQSDRYDAIRDAAPFIYLAMAPLAALSLTAVSGRTLLRTLRIAGLAAALVSLLQALGGLPPVSSSILGSTYVQFFASRADLVGAAIGIGIVAWTAWPAAKFGASWPIVIGLLLVGTATVHGRTGLLALLTATSVAVFREMRKKPSPVPLLSCIATVILGAGLQVGMLSPVDPTSLADSNTSADTTALADSNTSADTTSLADSNTSAITSAAQSARWWIQERLIRYGTSHARIRTWTDVAAGMTDDRTWLLGGSAGSDYLYELCTGYKEAPTAILSGPKCAIDDYGPSPVVRDPHNWILNISITHGIVGLFIFVAALAMPAWQGRRTRNAAMPIAGVFIYLVTGSTFLISASYALLPMAFFVAWLVRNALNDASRTTPASPVNELTQEKRG